jgi:type VI protein secretion system component VasK
MLLVVAVGDYATGPFMIFDLFYLVPILFVTWYQGQRPGAAVAAVCAVVWFLILRYQNHPLTHPVIWAWNIVVWFLAMFLAVWLLAHLKREMYELRSALDQVRQLRGLLPICAWCKRIRNDEGYWQQLEHYIQERSDAKFTHGICPACATLLIEEDPRKSA